MFILFGLELLFDCVGSSRDWKPWKPESLSSALWLRIEDIEETLGRALRSPSAGPASSIAIGSAALLEINCRL